MVTGSRVIATTMSLCVWKGRRSNYQRQLQALFHQEAMEGVSLFLQASHGTPCVMSRAPCRKAGTMTRKGLFS